MYSGGNARDFITIGMLDTAVRESRERIESALINSGFGYPNKSVTINLAPRTFVRKARASICPKHWAFSGRWERFRSSTSVALLGNCR